MRSILSLIIGLGLMLQALLPPGVVPSQTAAPPSAVLDGGHGAGDSEARRIRLPAVMHYYDPHTARIRTEGPVAPVPPVPASGQVWPPGPVYEQIGESCVGYALAAWLDVAPQPIPVHPSGWELYQAARGRDGWPAGHQGTALAAALAVLQDLGFVHDWRVTQDVTATLAFLRTEGPIVIGADFPRGLLVFDEAETLLWTGPLSPHAWLCYGLDGTGRLACQNSAGPGWNADEGGHFHISTITLGTVLAHGQAWLIHKRAQG
jgi:hypothetical protein